MSMKSLIILHDCVTTWTESPLHIRNYQTTCMASKVHRSGVINLFYLLTTIDHNMFLMETALLTALTKRIRIHTQCKQNDFIHIRAYCQNLTLPFV